MNGHRTYTVVYEETDNGWSAYVPDLPGCVAASDTRQEVATLIEEAIHLHVELLEEMGEQVPQPGAWTGLVTV